MALWHCTGCTAAYSVGAARCPECGSTDYAEEGPDMPKLTVHGGATNAADDTPEEETSPGNSSETSSEKDTPSPKTSGSAARSRAHKTENHS